MFGHAGRFWRADVSAPTVRAEDYPADLAREFLGGNGFIAHFVRECVVPQVQPLAPGNALVFAVGPLTGTPVWGTSRGHVGTVSPQTGFFADSSFGGDFGGALKRTGCDAVVITGKARSPSILLLSEDGGSLVDAGDLWGTDTEATLATLKARYGAHSEAACIGPAGENGVIYANIICGGRRIGAAGRGGMGAVMGSKNLKAVVAVDQRPTSVSRPDELRRLLRGWAPALKEQTGALTTYGTPMLVNKINAQGMLGTRNNSRETFEHAEEISGEAIKEKYTVRDNACHGCPVACGKIVRVPRGEYAGRTLKMPEYETLYAMGSMLENRDLVSIFNGNGVCDLMGMDTISFGVTVAFLAECVETGIVSKNDLGAHVAFGDGAGMVELAKLVARREGVGELLALGSTRLAERFGGDADRLLHSVKGMEIAGHSPRGLRGMGLGYATSTRGGSHHDTRPKYPDTVGADPGFGEQVEYNLRSQHSTAVGDSLVMCRFTLERGLGPFVGDAMAQVVNAVTGWDADGRELSLAGERIYNLERCISVERGLTRDDDTLPWRVTHEPIPDGPAGGRSCAPEQMEKLLDEYYLRRGWDGNGIPLPETLARLGLPSCRHTTRKPTS